MRGKHLESAVSFTRTYLDHHLKPGWVCIDATLGHGNDLLYMSDMVGPQGRVVGFDIQKDAIDSSADMLKKKAQYQNYDLVHAGHETMADHVEGPVDFIIFNLGYLPKGDKTITTKETTTLEAIKAGLGLLRQHGLLWLVIYSGHEAGQLEARALEAYASQLEQKNYSVMKMQAINQANRPPYILAIEKKFED